MFRVRSKIGPGDVVHGASRPSAADALSSRPGSQRELRSRSRGDNDTDLHATGMVAATDADAPDAAVAARAGSAAGAANAAAADAVRTDGMPGLGHSFGGAVRCLAGF